VWCFVSKRENAWGPEAREENGSSLTSTLLLMTQLGLILPASTTLSSADLEVLHAKGGTLPSRETLRQLLKFSCDSTLAL
jgi:hypothetical protein